jgi:hypothetical protein
MDLPKYAFYKRGDHFHFGFKSNVSVLFEESFAKEISQYLIDINGPCNVVTEEEAVQYILEAVSGFKDRIKYVPAISLWCMSSEYFRVDPSPVFAPVVYPTVYHEIKAGLQRKYGDREGLFLANRFASAYRRYCLDNCADNFRFALMSNPFELMQYNRNKENGCCGFYDEELVFIDRDTKEEKKFVIGFNFGH